MSKKQATAQVSHTRPRITKYAGVETWDSQELKADFKLYDNLRWCIAELKGFYRA
jgi:hypothetical protein